MNKLSIQQEFTVEIIRDAYEIVKCLQQSEIPLEMNSQTILMVARLHQKEDWGRESVDTRDLVIECLKKIEAELHNIYLEIPST